MFKNLLFWFLLPVMFLHLGVVDDDGGGDDGEEDLSGLSDAERSALAGDDGDKDILADIAGDDEAEGGGDDGAADAADDDADAGADEESAAEFQAQFVAQPVDGYEEKIAAFASEKAELRQKLNSGEIDMDAYESAKDAITAKETDLRIQQSQAQNTEEQNKSIAAQKWQWQVEQFFGDEKNTIYTDPMIHAALDFKVKELAKDPANADKSGQWFLKEADKAVREKFGQTAAAKASTPNRKPDLKDIPKTLGALPNAEIPETGSEEFGHLDKLDGMALEAALAKLSPDQQARYLGAA